MRLCFPEAMSSDMIRPITDRIIRDAAMSQKLPTATHKIKPNRFRFTQNYDFWAMLSKRLMRKTIFRRLITPTVSARPMAKRNRIHAPTQLNGQNTFAFPTSVTNAMGWITGYSQVDYFTGAIVDTEDIERRGQLNLLQRSARSPDAEHFGKQSVGFQTPDQHYL